MENSEVPDLCRNCSSLGKEEMELQSRGLALGSQTGHMKQRIGTSNDSSLSFCISSIFLHKLGYNGQDKPLTSLPVLMHGTEFQIVTLASVLQLLAQPELSNGL